MRLQGVDAVLLTEGCLKMSREYVLDEVLLKIDRYFARLQERTGRGDKWTARCSDGREAVYEIEGVKPLRDWQDDLDDLLLDIWSIRNYLAKERGEEEGACGKKILGFVDPYVAGGPLTPGMALGLAFDLANRRKHPVPDPKKSHSKAFPGLSWVKFSLPQRALDRLSFGKEKVTVSVGDADLVRYRVDVLDQNGNRIADAEEVARLAMEQWKRVFAQLLPHDADSAGGSGK